MYDPYSNILEDYTRKSSPATNIQHLTLQLVIHAIRPLRLLELAEIVRANSSNPFLTQDMATTKDTILTTCGPLLERLADEIVCVIHYYFTLNIS